MNKDLFVNVYKNKVLNTFINNQIRYIHRKIDKNSKKQGWNDLTPILLAQYGYCDQFRKLGAYYDVLECGRAAARYGHIMILKYIYREAKPTVFESLEFYKMALQSGKIPIIEYIYNTLDLSDIRYDYLEHAAIGGVDSCDWVVSNFEDALDSGDQSGFYENAAKSGNLDSFKWGYQHFGEVGKIRYERNGIRLWENAIEGKNISLLEFIFDNKELILRFDKVFDFRNYMYLALKYGNFEVMDWIFSKIDDISSIDNRELYSKLISNGGIRAIKYFSVKLGCNNNNKAEWFFNKCEQHGLNAIDDAIKQQKHKILIWLYEQSNYEGTLNPLGNNPSWEVLKWFTEHNRPERISTEQLLRLQFKSDVSIVQYIIRNRTEQFPNIPFIKRLILLKSDSIELLGKLPNSDLSLDDDDFNTAIKENRIESVKWIHSNTSTGCNEDGIRSAYFLEDSTMIEWLHKNRSESCHSEYIKDNFNRCSTSVRSFILHNKPEMIPLNVLEMVSDDFSLSKFIIDKFPDQYIYKDSLFDVAQSGKVEIVKYLHKYYKKHGINRGTNHFSNTVFDKTWKFAIKNQYSDLFIYLYENNSKRLSGNNSKSTSPMMMACKYGSLDICKYLHEHTPFKLSIDHMDHASMNGHLHLVRWIYENHRIKCSNKGLYDTACNDHFNVVRYLLDNQHNVTSDMFQCAIRNSELEIVKMYQSYQCKFDFNVVDFASIYGDLSIIKYFLENGHKGTTDAIDYAANYDYLDVIILLRTNGHKCTSKSIKYAYGNQNRKVVEWLLENIEFPTSEMPTIEAFDIYYNDLTELVKEYIRKQKIKEESDSDPIAPRTNKRQKKK